MRLQKSLPLFLVALFVMALAIGCAPAEQAAEPPAAESTEEMGHEDTMTAPDTTMADTTGAAGTEGHSEGSSGH